MMIVNGGGGGGNETWRIPKCQARRTNITACKVHKESGKKHTHTKTIEQQVTGRKKKMSKCHVDLDIKRN